jgi:hypothetical protein
MRTTIDLPDPLFRRTKALAAMRGTSMKELIVKAVERETSRTDEGSCTSKVQVLKLPHIRLKDNRKLDLTGFDFDDLLG